MTETIQLTSEQIAKYRSELADNSDFLAALDVIEEWDGDLADAAESIATLRDLCDFLGSVPFSKSSFSST
jgi:hypothetical protein